MWSFRIRFVRIKHLMKNIIISQFPQCGNGIATSWWLSVSRLFCPGIPTTWPGGLHVLVSVDLVECWLLLTVDFWLVWICVKFKGIKLLIKDLSVLVLVSSQEWSMQGSGGVVVLLWVFVSCEFPHYTMYCTIYHCMLGYKSRVVLVRVPGVGDHLVECHRGCT